MSESLSADATRFVEAARRGALREEKWDTRFLELAVLVSEWSKDRSTQVGAVIVDMHRRIISTGYNGMPRGVDDDNEERHQRPKKYLFMEHAERNAIFQAQRDMTGATLYVQFMPCAECARAIIQVGICRVVCFAIDTADPLAKRWATSHQAAREMFSEAGVRLVVYPP